MNKKRGFLTFLLFILTIAFIAFVIIMQHNFANPEFATAEPNSGNVKMEKQEETSDKEEDLDKKNEEVENEQKKTPTTKYVSVDLLNVRSEPTLESDIVGIVTLNQEVTSENLEDSEDWVQITTDDFTGYVKGEFLEDK